jgi:hypothetical protein
MGESQQPPHSLPHDPRSDISGPIGSAPDEQSPPAFGPATPLVMQFLRHLAKLPVRDWIQAAEIWQQLQGERWQRIDGIANAAVRATGLEAGHDELATRIGAIADHAHWLAAQHPNRESPTQAALTATALAAARALLIRSALGTQDFALLYHPFQHTIPLTALLQE